MIKVFLLLVFVLFDSCVVWSAGIGDTFSDFERQWNKGFRKEYDQGGGEKDIYIGYDKKHSISYSTGMHAFTGRVGNINGELWGMFGASNDALPTSKQFLTGIKEMMPSDSRLIAKYQSSDGGWLKEVYVYKSASLSKIPGIEKAFGYYMDSKSIGKFFLIMNHNIYDNKYIINFHLFLGNGQYETRGMKKLKATM